MTSRRVVLSLEQAVALPYATLCIECQREAERYGKSNSSDADWGRVLDSSGDADVSINDIELDVS